MASLKLALLGNFQARLDDQSVEDLRTAKVQALLAYLAAERTAHRREHLMTLLWPGMPEKSARHNLRQVLYQLRQAIPEVSTGEDEVPLLLSDRQTVQLNPMADVTVDLAQFAALLAETKTHTHAELSRCAACRAALEEAVALYRGDFLAEFYLEDSAQFEDWAAARRAHYRREILRALETLAASSLQLKEYERARVYAERQLVIDKLRESAHRQLMESLALSGRRAEALRQYENLIDLLQGELNVEPAAETAALAEEIRTELVGKDEKGVQLPDPVVLVEVAAETPGVSHNLPPQPTPFIGREKELTELGALITDPEVRLVTIVGPGGMGKTRLALAAAQSLVDTDGQEPVYPEGVFFVSLAPIIAVDQLVRTLAEAINFQLQADPQDKRSPGQQVGDYLCRKQMLLILDNFEQLLTPAQEAANLLVEIWGAALGVQLLITSRERLGLPMEQVYPLGGLAYPEEQSVVEKTEYEAAELFLQAARRVRPGYQLIGAEEKAALARVCNLVGGMPLALELAAGWVDVISISEINEEIQQGLDFLETELSGIPARHRGMRVVYEATWRRLSEGEQDALVRFSVFRGGCTREAAQKVTGATLRTMARLVDKSLIQYQKETGRYQIHGLMRQFAAEKLAASPETETAAQQAHCEYFVSAVENWEKELKSPRLAAALVEFQADYENIRHVWEWALSQDRLSYLLQIISGLGEYFESSYRELEARRLFGEASARLHERHGPSPASAEGIRLLANLLARQSFFMRTAIGGIFDENTEELHRKGLALLASPALAGEDTRREEAFIRHRLGWIVMHDGRIKEQQMHLEVSLRLYRELGDQVGIGDLLARLALRARREGNLEQFERYFTESLSLRRQTGDPRRLASSFMNLGYINRFERLAYKEAFASFKQAYTVSEAGGDIYGMVKALRWTAWMGWFLGNFDLALESFDEAQMLLRKINNQYMVALTKINIGLTQFYRGQFNEAEVSVREGLAIDPRADTLDTKLILSLVFIHRGQYEVVLILPGEIDEIAISEFRRAWVARILGWVALAKEAYWDALAYGRRSVEQSEMADADRREAVAWSRVPLGLAFFSLGQHDEAHQMLFESLKTCVEIRAFLPLMHLMPVLPVVLAADADDDLKARAVELYAMAESLPFVGNSQLFADLAGKPMAAVADTLPPEVVAAARARGHQLDWWETAQALLEELADLGWKGN